MTCKKVHYLCVYKVGLMPEFLWELRYVDIVGKDQTTQDVAPKVRGTYIKIRRILPVLIPITEVINVLKSKV